MGSADVGNPAWSVPKIENFWLPIWTWWPTADVWQSPNKMKGKEAYESLKMASIWTLHSQPFDEWHPKTSQVAKYELEKKKQIQDLILRKQTFKNWSKSNESYITCINSGLCRNLRNLILTWGSLFIVKNPMGLIKKEKKEWFSFSLQFAGRLSTFAFCKFSPDNFNSVEISRYFFPTRVSLFVCFLIFLWSKNWGLFGRV